MRTVTALLVVIVFTCSGCFRRFVMTDKQLQTYYSDKAIVPTYFTIQTDSFRLFCATTGADTLPPLLIIHGAPGAWYGSRNIMEDTSLNHHFHIIAVDRPGFNKSTFHNKRKAVTSISIQANIIYEALRLNRSRQQGIIMGSSYGGPIAALIAIQHPQSFYHLVMLAPALDPGNEKFWWFHRYIKHGPVKWLLPRFMRHATDEKFAHVNELKALLPKWPLLQTPVTVVQGDSDKIVPPANLMFAKKLMQDKPSRLISLHGAGHLVRWQRPDLVRKILLESPPGNNSGEIVIE